MLIFPWWYQKLWKTAAGGLLPGHILKKPKTKLKKKEKVYLPIEPGDPLIPLSFTIIHCNCLTILNKHRKISKDTFPTREEDTYCKSKLSIMIFYNYRWASFLSKWLLQTCSSTWHIKSTIPSLQSSSIIAAQRIHLFLAMYIQGRD